MVGRKKTHVKSGNRNRSRSPARSKQAATKGSAARGGRPHQPKPTATTGTSEAVAQPTSDQQPPLQDTAHQQKLLSIFQGAFDAVLSSGHFNATLQEVKAALFKREFDVAFGNEEFLEAYAARWSPTRTLCYASVLDGIGRHLEALRRRAANHHHHDDGSANVPRIKVLAIGAAAAELVAFASYLSRQPAAAAHDADIAGAITLVDSAPWGRVVEKLRAALAAPPPLSKYASAALHAANAPINEPARLHEVVFQELDVLTLDQAGLASLVSPGSEHPPVLVTLLFTLNELFTGGGVGKTTTFLLMLASTLPVGSLLLVVDSPGSYSETTVGKEAKRYPMAWLLDKILTGTTEGENERERWEKVESKDSVWFRLGGELRYPIPLEDMRYQMHLYRKGPGGGDEEEQEEAEDAE